MREVIFSPKFNRELKKMQLSASEKILLDLNGLLEKIGPTTARFPQRCYCLRINGLIFPQVG
jgi:mRNA-degrading endonuclease RelE of RelBE toxin-antitoxin system